MTIPYEYEGWWRIVHTGQWVDEGLDLLGPAMLSFERGRLRMHCLLAYVDARTTKRGVSFTWEGAWEFDPVSGRGTARLRKDGRLSGRIYLKHGDDSSFLAERCDPPDAPIPDPPSYRDKWSGRY